MSQAQIDFEDLINQHLTQKKMFCICCLEQTGVYIKLANCAHREYLDTFLIPYVNSSIPDTVCCKCHDTLKKITQFDRQVRQSFDVLLKKVGSLERSRNIKTHLEISKTLHLNIPELIDHVEETAKSEKINKIKNIETALEILNRNTRSLESLTSYHNFIGLTETLLQATHGNLDFSSINTTVLPESKITATSYGTAVSPVEIKEEPVVNTDIELNNEYALQDEVKRESDIDIVHERVQNLTNNNRANIDLDYKSVALPENNNIKSEKEMSEKNNIIPVNNDIEHTDNKNRETLVSPIENKMQCDDVTIVSMYGTAVLPDGIKCDPDNFDNSQTKIENSLGENRQKEYELIKSTTSRQNIGNDGVGLVRKRRTRSLCLIPIKLSKKELQSERQMKLTSSEFLQWEYRCTQCIIGFIFKENLDDHIQRKHVMTCPEGHVTCEICHQVVLDSDVKEHKFRHYNRLECKKCNKRFVLFDEAYDHYSSVHIPLKNKRTVKQQLSAYWQSKRFKTNGKNAKKRRTKRAVSETVPGTTTEVGSTTHITETLSEA